MKQILKSKYVQGIIVFLIGILLSRLFPSFYEGYTSNEKYKVLEEENFKLLINKDSLEKERIILIAERDSAAVNSERLAEGIRAIDEELKVLIHEREVATHNISNARTNSELLIIFTELDSLAGNR